MHNEYKKLQKKLGVRVRSGEILAKYTTLKIGGPADLFYEATTSEELTDALVSAWKLKIPVFVLGGGSNSLVGDKGFRGLVVRNITRRVGIVGIKGRMRSGRSRRSVFVKADSGVNMNSLVRFTVDNGLKGLEMHLGLPGTVGGAVYMNSKWMHPEGYTGDPLFQATIFDKNGQVRLESKSYFRFGYDSSSLQKTGEIVISVIFILEEADKEVLWQTANDSIAYRRNSQPQGVTTAGCTFRNISRAEALTYKTPNLTRSAGELIDLAGLKGEIIGEAQISPIHANFFINRGKATASDMVQLIDKARKQVLEKFGVNLEEEIVRVGEF